jgi:hypothetical protein
MKILARLSLPALLLGCSVAAFAQQQHNPVLITTPQAGADSNINLQTNTGSACAAPSVGNCGSCAVTCPTGHAAMCKPGLAVNNQSGASCLNPPECKCQ